MVAALAPGYSFIRGASVALKFLFGEKTGHHDESVPTEKIGQFLDVTGKHPLRLSNIRTTKRM
jgi:hypothetical protein